MKNPPEESTSAEILFVGIERADLPEALVDRLRTRGDLSEYVADVYRALARVGRHAPAAVVVAVDWLSTDELEFFEILGSAHADIAVYALGADRAQAKVDRAAGHGATILTTLDDLADLCRVTDDATPSPHHEPEPGFPRNKTDSEIQDPLASAGNVFDAELDERIQAGIEDVAPPSGDLGVEDREADAEAEDDGENGSGAVRVPWLSQGERPRRVPPPRVPPDRVERPEADTSSPSPTVWEDDDDPPLLSDEELRALLGDDATLERDR